MPDALCATEPGVGLVVQMAVLCLLALSAWLVLRVGRVSLGQQAYFAIGAYSAGLFTAVWGWSLWAALFMATLCGAISAGVLCWPCVRLPGLHHAVATLAVAELVRLGLSAWVFQVRGDNGQLVGPDGVNGFREIRWLFDHQWGQTAYMLISLAALLLVVIALLWVIRTRWGVAMQAIGHDDALALSQGLPVHQLRLLSCVLAGAVAALAGAIYAHQLTYIEPAIFDAMLGIHAVGYSMLGGLASPVGPLLGALFDLGLLEATRLFEGWRMVLFGTLVAASLRWRPRGVLHEALAHRLSGWARRWTHSGQGVRTA